MYCVGSIGIMYSAAVFTGIMYCVGSIGIMYSAAVFTGIMYCIGSIYRYYVFGSCICSCIMHVVQA